MGEQGKKPSVRKDNLVRKEIGKKETILEVLRSKGHRITKQRKIVIDIILENDCSCCKEIYYQANRINSDIGIATVYRMVKTLEDIGAINRNNQYKVSIDESFKDDSLCRCEGECMVILKNNKRIKLSAKEFNQVLKVGLKIIGLVDDEEIDSIVI